MIRSPILRDCILHKPPALGTFIRLSGSPEAVLLAAAIGFDFVVVDREHSSFSDETVSAMILAAKSTHMNVLVRPSDSSSAELGRLLDMGADGLMIPHVETKAMAEMIIMATHYYPEGKRSLSLGYSHTGFRNVDPVEFTTQANKELLILVQIESEKASDNRNEILSTPDVDGFIIGPGDLSQSYGVIGQTHHPEVEKAVSSVLECGIRNTKVCGTYASNAEDAILRMKQGFNLIIVSSDIRLIHNAGSSILSDIRNQMKD